MPRGRRGFSLALVLGVVSLVLVVGAAMAALSSFSLNAAARVQSRARADALAQAVVAQLSYELDERPWLHVGNPQGYPDMSKGKGAIKQRFSKLPPFPDASSHVLSGELTAWVDFDSPTYFSVDNLTSDVATAGFADIGTSRTSVPPYSLSLVITTGLGSDRRQLSDVRHFEAMMSRGWPYGVYSIQAPTSVGDRSRIRGSLYTEKSTLTVESGVMVQGSLACAQGQDKHLIQVDPGAKITGGVYWNIPPVLGFSSTNVQAAAQRPGGNRQDDPDIGGFFSPPQNPSVGDNPTPSPSPQTANLTDPFSPEFQNASYQNLYASDPDGNQYVYASDFRRWLETGAETDYKPQGSKGKEKDDAPKYTTTSAAYSPYKNLCFWRKIGKDSQGREMWEKIDPQSIPVDDLVVPKEDPPEKAGGFGYHQGVVSIGDFGGWGWGGWGNWGGVRGPEGDPVDPPAPGDTVRKVRLLVSPLALKDGYYEVGPLTNNVGWKRGGRVESLRTGNKDGPASLDLKNSVLMATGDLDVQGLTGDNSTLYVKGNLFLNGGNLNAKEKGMLILADNMFMEARGDFRGLIAARGSVELAPKETGEQLSVKGSVLSAGQALKTKVYDSLGNLIARSGPATVLISNTSLYHDPRYTTGINRLGTARTLSFREVP